MAKIKGVLLDVDGTLLDSNDAHAHAWVEALNRGGHNVSFVRVRGLIGMGSDNLLPTLIGVEKESPEGGRLSEWWSEIFESKYLPELKPTPGARELVARMKGEGLKLVVASSAKKDMLGALLDIAGVKELVEDATTSSEAEHSKPDPDIVLSALKKVGLPPEEVLMLGDTPYDIEAAGKAGIGVIALRCGGWRDEELAGAIAVYEDPSDLLARYTSSPLGVYSVQQR